ncbi:MAG: hypothetical protein ACE5R6_10585 [Candidatus Heimdallarchaeota archaeon]
MNDMKSMLVETLRGNNAHEEPLQALEGLDAELAYHMIAEGILSCWEIL